MIYYSIERDDQVLDVVQILLPLIVVCVMLFEQLYMQTIKVEPCKVNHPVMSVTYIAIVNSARSMPFYSFNSLKYSPGKSTQFLYPLLITANAKRKN